MASSWVEEKLKSHRKKQWDEDINTAIWNNTLNLPSLMAAWSHSYGLCHLLRNNNFFFGCLKPAGFCWRTIWRRLKAGINLSAAAWLWGHPTLALYEPCVQFWTRLPVWDNPNIKNWHRFNICIREPFWDIPNIKTGIVLTIVSENRFGTTLT